MTEPRPPIAAQNLRRGIPEALPEELLTVLARSPHLRIERIVSRGHRSPPDFWYDQDEHEWVLLLEGAARLEIEGQAPIDLRPGDHLHLPARCKHRVAWTEPDRDTLWLAVFHPPAEPTPPHPAEATAPDARALDDDALLAAFEAATLPLASWTHEGHVRVAWLYLDRHGLEPAIERLRSGLKRFIAAHAIPSGPDQGYHETLTVAWATLIDTTRRAYGPEADSRAFCAAHPQLLAKTLMRLYYTRPHIMSAEARARFLEPDLAPLPRATELP